MEVVVQYNDKKHREDILRGNSDKFLVAERNLLEGDFLVFSTIKPIEIEIEDLKQEDILLKAQNNATSERADFIEDIIAEMAMQVYQ